MSAEIQKNLPSFSDPNTQLIVNFLNEIGIETAKASVSDGLPIPGIAVENGVMIIDEERLTYPGDLLYQAGRIAILKPEQRKEYMGQDNPDQIQEATEGMMAMCWSWAALTHLNIAPEIVFHNGGYKGQSMQIIHGFQSGEFYMGLPMLQLYEMSYEPHQAAARELKPFPYMYKWTND